MSKAFKNIPIWSHWFQQGHSRRGGDGATVTAAQRLAESHSIPEDGGSNLADLDYFLNGQFRPLFHLFSTIYFCTKFYNLRTDSRINESIGLFFIYFRSFQANNTIFTTNQC